MGRDLSMVRCLLLDLEKKLVDIKEIPVQEVPDLTGGFGVQLGLWKELRENTLAEVNNCPILGVSTGPLTGTGIPGSAGFSWCFGGKSGIAVQAAESRFAAELRYAGFDHLLLYGRSDSAVQINICDCEAEIVVLDDAEPLKDIYASSLRHTDHINSVVLAPHDDTVLEDRYFTIGTGLPAQLLKEMHVLSMTVAGYGGIEIADSDAFVKQCIALYKSCHTQANTNYADRLNVVAYYLSPWHTARLDLNEEASKVFPVIDLADEKMARDERLALMLANLGLSWDENFPFSDKIGYAAELLSSKQGQKWNDVQLNEMVLRLIRVNQEFQQERSRENAS